MWVTFSEGCHFFATGDIFFATGVFFCTGAILFAHQCIAVKEVLCKRTQQIYLFTPEFLFGK